MSPVSVRYIVDDLDPAIGFYRDDLGFEVQPTPAPHDTDEHGTHTAGTIAGRTVANSAIGVAPEALLVSAIVIEGGNVTARILAGSHFVRNPTYITAGPRSALAHATWLGRTPCEHVSDHHVSDLRSPQFAEAFAGCHHPSIKRACVQIPVLGNPRHRPPFRAPHHQ